MTKRPTRRLANAASIPKRLTPKQHAFAAEYLKDLNGAQAAIRSGYSARSAKVQANQLLNNPLLKSEIQRLKSERDQRVRIDADWILRRLREEVVADVKDIMNEDGSIKPISAWPPVWRQGLVSGISVTETWGTGSTGKRVRTGTVTKLQLADRGKRVELLGRHVSVRAFEEKATAVVSDPLRALFDQIKGQVIRPAVERTIEANIAPVPNTPTAVAPPRPGLPLPGQR